jgi:hypothetical protein
LDEGSVEKTLSRLRQYDAQTLDLRALPPAIVDTVRKGLSTAMEDRYADADEFSRAVCAAAPFSARRVDLESFWDALFPDAPRRGHGGRGPLPGTVRVSGKAESRDRGRFVRSGSSVRWLPIGRR